MLSPHVTHRLAVAGTSFVLIASVATGITMINSNKSEPQVKGVATKVATVPATRQDKPAPAVKPTGDKVATPAPAAKPDQSNTPTTAKKSAQSSATTGAAPIKAAPTAPASSTPAAPTVQTPAVTPKPTPAPAPVPSFQIVLREADAYTFDMTPFGSDSLQRVVPFDIVYDAGFEKVNYQQPGCRIISAPIADHKLLCDLAQKEADTGGLVMQYNSATARGRYLVEAIYPINSVTKTAVYEFVL